VQKYEPCDEVVQMIKDFLGIRGERCALSADSRLGSDAHLDSIDLIKLEYDLEEQLRLPSDSLDLMVGMTIRQVQTLIDDLRD
jgi:acyl carrier protein